MKNLLGQRFLRLVVTEYAGRSGDRKRHQWKCVCDCGAERVVDAANLLRGSTKSCGCYSAERAAKRCTKHGGAYSSEYAIWHGMIRRCTDTSRDTYEDYGARGITVCQRWMESFESFVSDMGPRPSKKHSIDRIDNDGNYEPGNCRWATMAQQRKNTRRTKFVTAKGRTQALVDWAKETGLQSCVIASRLNRGWSSDDAVSTPVIPTRRGRKDGRQVRSVSVQIAIDEWESLVALVERENTTISDVVRDCIRRHLKETGK